MSHQVLQIIQDISIFWRAFAVFMLLWIIYILFSRVIFKLLALIPSLINWFWQKLYLLINNIMHIFHKVIGRAFASMDQSVTNFFGYVSNFLYKVKSAIENTRFKAKPLFNNAGYQVVDVNGKPQYQYIPKRPFVGITLLLSLLMVIWISVPTWLQIEEQKNAFTAAYHKYIDIEDTVLKILNTENIVYVR